MRVATFFSVATIVALATAGPAFGFAKVKKTPTAPGYMLVKNDGGRANPFPNCENSPTCITGTITVLISRNGTSTLDLNCFQLGGCKVVGPR
jgi:hypothetical protein